MKTTRGDLLALGKNGTFDVIVHGCNCFCGMGNGIAGQIKKQFPAAYEADKATTKGDMKKLGTCTFATVPNDAGGQLTIVNAYTQYRWSGKERVADYDAIRACMKWLKTQHGAKKIGLPKIGAGLAGGDWGTIVKIMDEELAGVDATVVEYAP
jgi:O-acetyl-ADP-ribose deacetylase (regulator of RNase III)